VSSIKTTRTDRREHHITNGVQQKSFDQKVPGPFSPGKGPGSFWSNDLHRCPSICSPSILGASADGRRNKAEEVVRQKSSSSPVARCIAWKFWVERSFYRFPSICLPSIVQLPEQTDAATRKTLDEKVQSPLSPDGLLVSFRSNDLFYRCFTFNNLFSFNLDGFCASASLSFILSVRRPCFCTARCRPSQTQRKSCKLVLPSWCFELVGLLHVDKGLFDLIIRFPVNSYIYLDRLQ
jgi:hypothetical protein